MIIDQANCQNNSVENSNISWLVAWGVTTQIVQDKKAKTYSISMPE